MTALNSIYESVRADCLFVYSRPRCIIHNYRTDAAIQLQLSTRNIGSHLLNGASNCNKSFGQITSFPLHNSCRKNEALGVLSPKTNNSLSNNTESGIRQQTDTSNSNSVGTSSKTDTMDEFTKCHIEEYCRYYSNLLTVKLEKIKQNFKKQLAPSVEDNLFTTSVPNIFTEACTMKPSGKRDQNCQTKSPEKPKIRLNEQTFIPQNLNINKHPSCLLPPVFSLIDIRTNQDTEDLKTVYNILTAIEGRVRRLKNNLRM